MGSMTSTGCLPNTSRTAANDSGVFAGAWVSGTFFVAMVASSFVGGGCGRVPGALLRIGRPLETYAFARRLIGMTFAPSSAFNASR